MQMPLEAFFWSHHSISRIVLRLFRFCDHLDISRLVFQFHAPIEDSLQDRCDVVVSLKGLDSARYSRLPPLRPRRKEPVNRLVRLSPCPHSTAGTRGHGILCIEFSALCADLA